jgi:glycosyltransferase involved in cell wall biosynthesis
MPRVSVVIPAYNHARYVGEAIRSVLAQTFQDFEVIVVDDGSTDETGEVVAALKEPRITYVRQSNRGQAAARNTGIRASSGEYVAFLDDDDLWLPDKLETQVGVLDSRAEVALVCSDHYVFDEQTGETLGRLWHDRPFHYWIDPFKAARDPLEALLRRGCFIAPSATVVRREALLAVWGFDESFEKNHEDWDLFVRICRRFPIATVDVPLARNRQHGANTQRNWEYMCESGIAVFSKVIRTYGLSAGERWLVRRRLGQTLSRYGRNLVRDGRTRPGRDKLMESIRVHPLRIRPYVWLAGSFLGSRWIMGYGA